MDIGDSFQRTTDKFFDFLPNLLGFLVVLLIGYIIAKVVAGVVRKLLEKLKVDQSLRDTSSHRYVEAALPGASPSGAIARVVFWLIFIFAITIAVGALGIPAATGFMSDVLAYLPNVIVAILIFIVAALLAGAVAGAVGRFMGDTATGKVVAAVVPAVIMTIAFFMILEQLQIAPEIVRIAFTAIMFALALGLALAFGLGGRDLAADVLRQARDKGSAAATQARSDSAAGGSRMRAEYESGSSAASPQHPAAGSHGTDTLSQSTSTAGGRSSYGGSTDSGTASGDLSNRSQRPTKGRPESTARDASLPKGSVAGSPPPHAGVSAKPTSGIDPQCGVSGATDGVALPESLGAPPPYGGPQSPLLV